MAVILENLDVVQNHGLNLRQSSSIISRSPFLFLPFLCIIPVFTILIFFPYAFEAQHAKLRF